MSVLRGRERWLYSARPSLDRFNAAWFGLLGVAVLGVGIAAASPVSALAVLPFAVAMWSWKRASWTAARPELRRRVVAQQDASLTGHPVRYAVVGAVAFGIIGASELYRYTLGSRGSGHAPPVWSWPVVVLVGAVAGGGLSRLRLKRARRRQAGQLPYPGDATFRDSYGAPSKHAS